MTNYETFEIPEFCSQRGITLPISIAYKTYGNLSTKKDNAILIPTFYGGRHEETEYFFAEGRALNLEDHFIIVPNMIGNGYSTSPSNALPAYRGSRFPIFTIYDNVCCQHTLVTKHLGIERLRLVIGFSMGAQQSFQWGACHSDIVDGILPICGSARISEHNKVFLESAINTLRLDSNFNQGEYESPPLDGLLAFGHVYSAWLFSQDFFREKIYLKFGFESAKEVVEFTQKYFLANDANNLIAMANTWIAMDISENSLYMGDFKAALNSIKCPAIVMPSDSDLYFRVADNEYEVSHMPKATLRTIPSKWGHGAGFGMDDLDNRLVDQAILDIMNNY